MIFSDLLTDVEALLKSLYHLRHRGNEIILFQILDEAEVHFPFEGLIEFEDVESPEKLVIDARGMREDYLDAVRGFQEQLRAECAKVNVDLVTMDTSVSVAKALLAFLIQRT